MNIARLSLIACLMSLAAMPSQPSPATQPSLRHAADPDMPASSSLDSVGGTEALRWRSYSAERLVRRAVRMTSGVSENRIDLRAALPEGRFDLDVPATGTPEERARLLRQTVEDGFGLSVREDDRELNVFVIRFAPGRNAENSFKPTQLVGDVWTGDSDGQTYIRGSRLTAGSIAYEAERGLDRPVVDETDANGDYDFDLSWKTGDVESLRQAIARYGLELVPARRTLRYVSIVPRGESASRPTSNPSSSPAR